MRPLTDYIKELLFEQDCVVIPDFGGFIANFIKSTYFDHAGTYTPPFKRIVFNEVLSFDDGLLSSYIASQEALSRSEALELIKQFVAETRKKLALGETVELSHLGSFKLNSENKLQFEPFSQLNYHGESFGMQPITVSPKMVSHVAPTITELNTPEHVHIPAVTETPVLAFVESQTETSPGKRWWIAASVTVLLACATAWMLHADQHLKSSSMSSMNPLTPIVEQVSSYYKPTPDWPIQPNPEAYADSLIKVLLLPSSSKDLLIDRFQNLDNEITTPPTLSIAITPEPSPETAKTVVEPARKISPSKLRYFVIGGAFGNLKNALKLKKQLNNAGYSAAFVVEPSANEDLYKVAAVAYNSPNKAYAATQRVSLQTGATAWVMKRK
jgi:hypothetical protein